jgi:cation:H+ antiporter
VATPDARPAAAAEPASVAHPGRLVALMATAVAATVPGLVLRLGGLHPAHWIGVALYGLAIVGAAFVLAWGAETLQLDVSRGLALAVLALIAVLPEYVVDFTFAAKAGGNPEKYAPLALANMTGSNRLLIGVGWAAVVLIAAWRLTRSARKQGYEGPVDTEVHLDRSHSIEIAFLAIATLYSLTLPLKHNLTLFDAGVLILLFVLYGIRISRSPAEEPHLVGPARLLGQLSNGPRRVTVALLLAFSAAVILLCAAPFAESLVGAGEEFGVSTFLLVQWLAPLASEAPELLVACLFAWRLNTNGGLGTLVSSKVNQWTLLVGSLPIVFVVFGGAASGLPLDALQREELFLTAAQSAFAVTVLANRSISVREALALFGLFVSQFVLGAVLPEHLRAWERVGVGIVYLVLAAYILVRDRRRVPALLRDGLRTPADELVHDPGAAAAPASPM